MGLNSGNYVLDIDLLVVNIYINIEYTRIDDIDLGFLHTENRT